MLSSQISLWALAGLIISLPAVQTPRQVRVVDLTKAAPEVMEWKVIESETGGPVGTRPLPPSYAPVTVRLSSCTAVSGEFFFSIELQNSRELEIEVPVGVHSKAFDRQGLIKFRELLIRIGTATDPKDGATFQPKLDEIALFGDESVPGSVAMLAPGERLVLRLKSVSALRDPDIGSLRVRLSGFDQTLTPTDGGFRKKSTWIPALFAISDPGCTEQKREAK